MKNNVPAPPGDEYAATRNGNNNWYGHDNEMTWFDWEALEAQRNSYFRFYRCGPKPWILNNSTPALPQHLLYRKPAAAPQHPMSM